MGTRVHYKGTELERKDIERKIKKAARAAAKLETSSAPLTQSAN
jgi:hypothetical protein